MYIYTALLRYILQSLQCYINDRRTYFLNIVAVGVFQFRFFLLLKYAAQVIKMGLHRCLNWVKTHSGKQQLNFQNKNFRV